MEPLGDKEPRLDGFNFSFNKAGWDCERRIFATSGNPCHFLFLTVEVPNLDYRPMSLEGYVYKLLSNIIANWVKSVLAHAISQFHDAAVNHRHLLLDGVFVAK